MFPEYATTAVWKRQLRKQPTKNCGILMCWMAVNEMKSEESRSFFSMLGCVLRYSCTSVAFCPCVIIYLQPIMDHRVIGLQSWKEA